MKNLTGKGPKPKYPWRTLEVGQSFQVNHLDATRHSLRCNAYQSGLRLNRKFSVRKSETGTIITRTA